METEHRHTEEVRHVKRREGLRVIEYDQTRYVCRCGQATKWRSAAYIAKREADRHALDGQQSLV